MHASMCRPCKFVNPENCHPISTPTQSFTMRIKVSPHGRWAASPLFCVNVSIFTPLMEPVRLLLNAVARRDAQLPRTISECPSLRRITHTLESMQLWRLHYQDKLDFETTARATAVWTIVFLTHVCRLYYWREQKIIQQWQHSPWDKTDN